MTYASLFDKKTGYVMVVCITNGIDDSKLISIKFKPFKLKSICKNFFTATLQDFLNDTLI